MADMVHYDTELSIDDDHRSDHKKEFCHMACHKLVTEKRKNPLFLSVILLLKVNVPDRCMTFVVDYPLLFFHKHMFYNFQAGTNNLHMVHHDTLLYIDAVRIQVIYRIFPRTCRRFYCRFQLYMELLVRYHAMNKLVWLNNRMVHIHVGDRSIQNSK